MRKARAYTFFALLIALVTFGLARALTLRHEFDLANRSANDTLAAGATIAAEYARRTFETADLVHAIVSDHVRAAGGVRAAGNDPRSHELLVDLAARTIGDYLMVVDDAGFPVVSSAAPTPPRIDLSDREWFRMHKEGGIERYVGPSIYSRITNEILFTYSRPIIAGNSFAGAFQTAMKPSFFEGIPISRASQRGSEIALWALDGRLIGASGIPVEQVERGERSAAIRSAVMGADAGLVRLGAPETPRRAAFRVLAEWGVVVTASVPEDDIVAPWKAERRNALLTYLALTAALTALGGFAFFSAAEEEKLTRRIRDKNARLEAAVAERDLLIREVHHRVKNNLQVVSSLLRINARRTSDVKALVAATQDRIQAMATMHEVIYTTDVSAFAELGAYLRRLTASVESANALKARGVTIEIDCEPISVAMDRMTPLGLIVVEVLSNAMKHGFADGEGGKLVICGRRRDGRVQLDIRNDGAPLGGAPKPAWGGRLIDALAAQINGASNLFQDGSWTVFTLAFPEDAQTGDGAKAS